MIRSLHIPVALKGLFITCFLLVTSGLYAQTTYTGLFYGPDNQGMRTDSYFNLVPQAASTTVSNWNIFHKSGATIFSAYYGSATPYIYIGQGRVTDLYVNGNVGIGTGIPLAKLHISGSIRGAQTAGALRIQTDGGYVDVGAQNAVYAHFTTDRTAYFFDKEVHIASGVLKSFDGPLNLYPGGTQLGVTVLTNGNVGVGTQTPQAKLHVNGSIRGAQTAGTLRIQADGGYVDIGSQTASYMQFITDRPAYYFDKEIQINGGALKSYNGPLSLYAGATQLGITVLNTNGNVGLGTATPAARLHVVGSAILDDSKPSLYTGTATTEQNRYLHVANSPQTSSASGLKAGGVLVADTHNYANPGKNDLIVKGAVGIGTTLANNPNGYALAVNGKIGAHEVRVEKTSETWPDYVFEPAYTLPDLKQVEQYIQANKHLQDIPSAEEISQNGHDVGNMDALLLKKVEELTLYIIQQQKEIEALKKRLDEK